MMMIGTKEKCDGRSNRRCHAEGEREMNDELKQLIEDAAKLLGAHDVTSNERFVMVRWSPAMRGYVIFNPCDPERGDLRRLMEAAELEIRFNLLSVVFYGPSGLKVMIPFEKGDYQSLVLAVLRAASAVWKARGGE